MSYRNNQSGFSALEIIIVVIVVAIIGFLGYTFYNNYQNQTSEKPAAASTDTPAITTTSDLDKASTAMDETEMESANTDDLSELEKDLSNF